MRNDREGIPMGEGRGEQRENRSTVERKEMTESSVLRPILTGGGPSFPKELVECFHESVEWDVPGGVF